MFLWHNLLSGVSLVVSVYIILLLLVDTHGIPQVCVVAITSTILHSFTCTHLVPLPTLIAVLCPVSTLQSEMKQLNSDSFSDEMHVSELN